MAGVPSSTENRGQNEMGRSPNGRALPLFQCKANARPGVCPISHLLNERIAPLRLRFDELCLPWPNSAQKWPAFWRMRLQSCVPWLCQPWPDCQRFAEWTQAVSPKAGLRSVEC
jgi:hypothetical protein